MAGDPFREGAEGRGVSACATCDGFFFKGKEIAVIGGGDTAMEEATFLTKFASKVTVIHRRDSLRGLQGDGGAGAREREDRLPLERGRDRGARPGAEEGHRRAPQGHRSPEGKTPSRCEGLFLAIGHVPNTVPFVGQLDMDENGYLVTVPGTSKTNLPGVFAAGDVQDHVYRQAITAAGTGCMAALDAERYLSGGH